jgi:heme/copper-type cytochrome/quinol oxidase subunit 3
MTTSGALADEGAGYEVVEGEQPELLGRNLISAAHLLASATAFFFLAFLFAYLYLRALNNGGMWKPKGVDASVGWGTGITLCTVVGAVLVRLGYEDHKADRRPAWRIKGALALALGVVALVLQVVAWKQQGFGPSDGGFASVYFGWTAFMLLFVLLTLFWLETVLAMSIRYRKIPSGAPEPGHASGDTYRSAHDIRDPLSLVRAELRSLSFYFLFLAGIAVLSWVVLYLL